MPISSLCRQSGNLMTCLHLLPCTLGGSVNQKGPSGSDDVVQHRCVLIADVLRLPPSRKGILCITLTPLREPPSFSFLVHMKSTAYSMWLADANNMMVPARIEKPLVISRQMLQAQRVYHILFELFSCKYCPSPPPQTRGCRSTP